ncbi:MAG: LytR/AlgR family response regulator transcription factor [Spirosomataceae bacterium]
MKKTFTFPVLYCQAVKNYTILMYSDGKHFLSSYTMKKIESRLALTSPSFLRLHRAWIVNSNFISSVSKSLDGLEVVLVDGTKVPISRRRYKRYADILKTKYNPANIGF